MMMPVSRLVIPLLLGCGAISCSSAMEPIPGVSVPVTRLNSQPYSFTYYSQLQQPERLVIRDQSAWMAAWRSLWPNGAPIPAPPAIDFGKDMVVLAALGTRSTGGFSILVDSARTTTEGLIVFIGTSAPGQHCVTTQAFTQPVDLARLPRTDGAVRFVDVPAVEDCQ